MQQEQSLIRELLDKQACAELVYTLARGIDRMDEELIRSVFHADAVVDFGHFRGTAGEFVRWVMALLPSMKRTQHCICNQLIEVRGDVAHGESYVVAVHDMAGDKDMTMTFGGRYIDRFERRNGVWKNARRVVVSDWTSLVPSTDSWDRSPAAPRIFGRRDREDPSYRR
ncbi:MAG TPA: nuclear transport factor 2 family protein [Burkholderiales bacterium]|nr:nuclear transport factor 2 family protein [Burkholderiales bacterium]